MCSWKGTAYDKPDHLLNDSETAAKQARLASSSSRETRDSVRTLNNNAIRAAVDLEAKFDRQNARLQREISSLGTTIGSLASYQREAFSLLTQTVRTTNHTTQTLLASTIYRDQLRDIQKELLKSNPSETRRLTLEQRRDHLESLIDKATTASARLLTTLEDSVEPDRRLPALDFPRPPHFQQLASTSKTSVGENSEPEQDSLSFDFTAQSRRPQQPSKAAHSPPITPTQSTSEDDELSKSKKTKASSSTKTKKKK